MHALTRALIFATLSSVACSGPVVVAHRGASAEAPENTLAAYRLAIEQGARFAECDVHLAADQSVVVIHDETLERTTDGSGAVAERSASELAALDAGSWKGVAYTGEPVPELGRLLAAVGDELHLLVEVKAGNDIVERIAGLVGETRPRSGLTIISFDDGQVAAAARALPKVRRFLLRSAPDAGFVAEDLVAAAGRVQADGLGLQQSGVDAALVRALHEAKLEVFVWTVNEATRVDELLDSGVDGVITDHPAMGLERVDALKRRRPEKDR